MKLKRNQKGFTLVEIAIVMVIIGLLIGGVLKGQSMIQNARIKAYQNDIDSYRAAWYAYFDRYGYYPGDDPQATQHQWDISPTNGNGNGIIAAGEQPDVFEHLRGAKLIGGTGSAYPVGSYGGRYIISNNPNSVGGTGITAENIPGYVAESTDSKLDDGTFNTGSVRADAGYSNATVEQSHLL